MERVSKKKTQDTRDRILDAAEDVFNNRGYSNTTLNEIAEVAGVTRGAIYWHYKNKEDHVFAGSGAIKGNGQENRRQGYGRSHRSIE